MYARDLQGNEYPMMATYTIKDEINGNMDLSADLLPNKANLLFLKDIDSLWEIVTDDDITYTVIYSTEKGVGKSLQKSIRAIPKLYDHMNIKRVYEKYEGSFPIEELFSIVFRPTDYTYQLVGSWTNIEIEGFGDGETCLSMFQRVLNRIGAEFTFTDKVVTIREKIGTDSQVMYRHRLNASNIVPEIDAQEYWTYAKGFGNYEESKPEEAKLKREYTSPLARLLGKREAPPIRDGRVKQNATMDKALKKLVDESIKISVTADLVDLREKGYPYAQSKLGDMVTLIDERIGFQEEVRVAARSIMRDWRGKILDLSFTFGTQGLAKRYNAKINNAAKEVTDILSGKKKLPFQAMANEIQIVTKLLQSVQTQLTITEDGSLLAINKNDPNLVVILNAAGLGISDDGGKTFKNAITGRGIMGDRIIANSITADKLDANAITVGFNNNSTNLKLYGNRIEFYRDSKVSSRITENGIEMFRDGNTIAKINENGMEFWYGTRKIGRMGETGKAGSPDVRGVALNLEYTGDYITFGRKNSPSAETFSPMMILDFLGKFTGVEGLTVRGDLATRGIKSAVEGSTPLYLSMKSVDGKVCPILGNGATTAGICVDGSSLYLIDNNVAYRPRDLMN